MITTHIPPAHVITQLHLAHQALAAVMEQHQQLTSNLKAAEEAYAAWQEGVTINEVAPPKLQEKLAVERAKRSKVLWTDAEVQNLKMLVTLYNGCYGSALGMATAMSAQLHRTPAAIQSHLNNKLRYVWSYEHFEFIHTTAPVRRSM